MPARAVFLDRDDTVIADTGYIADPAMVKLLPGAAEAMRRLAQAGYKIVVVTNQSGIARGLLTEKTLEAIHVELNRQLAAEGVAVDAIYYCPFHPEGTVEKYACESELRKPSPGMLLKAAKDLDIDLAQSWMVGDGPRDVQAGKSAGCRTILIGEPASSAHADFSAADLLDASSIILGKNH